MDIIKILQEELGIRRGQVETTIKLIDEGNTIPFIARYRKEMTGSLDDETLRNFHERLLYLRNLEERKEAIKKNIEEQGKLTKELAKQIEEVNRSVPRLDLKNKQELATIPGTPPDLLNPPVGCPFCTRCSYCMPICKEEMPEATEFGGEHKAACWLHHPMAPKVEMPDLEGEEL